MWKSLVQIADDYAASANLIRKRLSALRLQLKDTSDPEETWKLQRRIAELTPILTECNKMERMCRHYYDGNRKTLGQDAIDRVRGKQVSRRRSHAGKQSVPPIVQRAIKGNNGNN